MITIQDIAHGLVAYRARPEELYDWAWALLSWDFLAIAELMDWHNPTSASGAVQRALWTAAYRLPLDADTERTVARIAAGRRALA